MSGGGQTQTTVQNKDPWGPSQAHLQNIMQSGANLFNSGAGTQQWGGDLISPLAMQGDLGLNAITDTARGMQGSSGQPYNYAQGMIQNNGLTSAFNQPMGVLGNVASGQNGITTGGLYGDIAGSAAGPTAASQNLGGMASGADAGKNPYLTQMLDANAARIGNRVASQMSGAGRYGSGGHTDLLARSITEANNPVLAQAYESDRNRMLSASGQIDSAQRAQEASRLAATQGMTGVQAQNIGNQMGAAGQQAGILQSGQQNAQNWAGMIPQLQQSAFMPGNQLMAAGQYVTGRDQALLDARRQQFEQQQNMPWTQLARYSGAVSGLSPMMANAGTMTGTQNTQKDLGFMDFASLFGGGGNSAAAGGANALSSILGLLSDRNEKTDIKKVGEDKATGLPFYSYRYKGDPKTYPKIVGPMAQDVEKAFPGSTDRIGGKLYIKREALGIAGL
jgi:hypothetical protein